MKQERLNEIYGVLFLLLGLFLLIGILFHDPGDHPFFAFEPNRPIQNPTGIIGAYLSHYLVLTLGLSAYSVPFLILFWSSCFFLQKVPNKKLIELVGIIIAIFSFASILALIVHSDWKVQAGGLLGYFCATTLQRYFGFVGGLIIAFCCLLLATLLFTDFLLYPIFQRIWNAIVERFENRALKRFVKIEGSTPKPRFAKKAEKPVEEERKSRLPDTPIRLKQYLPNIESEKKFEKKLQSFSESKEKKIESEKEKLLKQSLSTTVPSKKDDAPLPEIKISAGSSSKQDTYTFPSLDLLSSPAKDAVPLNEDFHEKSKLLEETLADFGIEVKVVEVEQGPVLTRYEILPAPGVKVTRILSLSDDLALAMKAPSIRFIAPIPGKSAIGIEVPNSVTMKVYLKELLDSKEFRAHRFKLPLALGKDTSGKPMFSDLAEMPHILIAGTTGSGKTVCVNALIAGLVYSKMPSELKFVMVDPKMVELSVYNKLPHMLTPVVTDTRKAAATLNWVVSEMERRYKFFAHCGTRNIQAFNDRKITAKAMTDTNEEIPERLPYIVVVIDELADLMVVAQDKVEGAITRLAQLSRAVGIHLVLATQRPSVDVITGVIKANFPARISFKVASKIDSRTVLDMNGADKLIGKGDLLFLEPGREKPIRGQSAFVSDEEINAIVHALSSQGAPEFHEEIQAVQEGKTTNYNQEKDELYEEAVRVILETKQASVSMLQRRLRLGYGRASRIIDMMEQEGVVGPPQGSKPREILVDKFEGVSGEISKTADSI
ncbi:MAG: DNA translocase FtsK [Candidatus Omnitrophica bacterium]|nr:DNA translocase FtsK [Candidatus Omnitrophota bacterium]